MSVNNSGWDKTKIEHLFTSFEKADKTTHWITHDLVVIPRGWIGNLFWNLIFKRFAFTRHLFGINPEASKNTLTSLGARVAALNDSALSQKYDETIRKFNGLFKNHVIEQVKTPTAPVPTQVKTPPVSIVSDQEKKEILAKRKPLTDALSKYFELDEFGYIKKPKMDKAKIKEEITNNEAGFVQFFYDVSKTGDAAYCEDIRTTLAGMDIAPAPANKQDGTPAQSNVRPYSYIPSDNKATGTALPAPYKGKTKTANPYLGVWGQAIWRGFKEYREACLKKATGGRAHKVEQFLDYNMRVERVRSLHRSGLLLGRVANLGEVRDFMSHRYNMGNDILSTTLWPAEYDPLIMQLFSEFGTDTVGLLLDYSRAGSHDFGVSFAQNAGTVGSGFQNHKARIHQGHGASTLFAQQHLLQAYSTEVRSGGSPANLEYTLNPAKTDYVVKKKDARSAFPVMAHRMGVRGMNLNPQNSHKTVLWNEQTFYRGIERDFFLGLFVKSDSDNFSKELKNLFELQDRIRQKKGIYVPVFQFKGSTNELEELVPDRLLLAITGAKSVEPMNHKKSGFSEKLEKAGISEDMAVNMTKALGAASESVKSLFELQLLMFNMKDIKGQMTVKEKQAQNSYQFESVRILDNLHLVFPTTNKTQNDTAQQKDMFFSQADIKTIKNDPNLHQYLQKTLRQNLTRFLGISVSESGISFDSSNASLFDKNDVKKSDFAKVLSRAMQAVPLFQIFGQQTNKVVVDIVKEIRKAWPFIGITPGGIDMMLGSKEMQNILTEGGFKADALTKMLEPVNPQSLGQVIVPDCPFSINVLDPFKRFDLPQDAQMIEFLARMGIDSKGGIDQKEFDSYRDSDPHLFKYEIALIQTVQMLRIIHQEKLANTIMQNIRKTCPAFGYTAEGKDSSLLKSDMLMSWIQKKSAKQAPDTEFPFGKKQGNAGSASADVESVEEGGRFGRRAAVAPQFTRGGGRFDPIKPEGSSTINQPKIEGKDLQELVNSLKLISPFTQEQIEAAKALGLVNGQGEPLWTVEPQFHGGDSGKPKVPYIAIPDLLGQYAPHLMTGPAMQEKILERDKASFQLAIADKMLGKKDVSRLITHTLAVTTEGDKQVLRPSGLQFSQSINVPAGGNIEYNGGNEKHRFRSNDTRKYHQTNTGTGYTGMGAYKDHDLKQVEDYDAKLLSDEERRIKRAAVLPSAYVTVTAKGGYGSERTPLDRAYRVLYMETAGAQFEKYGRGAFAYQDGTVDSNELEASDFIIKAAAAAQTTPLFPSYYAGTGGKIPGHGEIEKGKCAKLGDGDFTKPFVELADGAIFNREAFQLANNAYMLELVIPAIRERTEGAAFYLKAILLGGGFFAQTDKAGNLREEVIKATLETYIKAIQDNLIPVGSVIEFPRYGEQKQMPGDVIARLKAVAASKKIELVWTPEGDVCDFNEQKTEAGNTVHPARFENNGKLIVLGAADVMSWSGNESSSASVEAAFANNSNLRLVMNWWANPKVLESIPKS